VTRLGNRFFTESHKSTLRMHYFKFILILDNNILRAIRPAKKLQQTI